MSDQYINGILSLVLDLLRKAEEEGLRVRVQPSKSGHTYNVGKWEEMNGKDSCDKTAENKEFCKMVEEETEDNVKHIESMIEESDKK